MLNTVGILHLFAWQSMGLAPYFVSGADQRLTGVK